VNVTDVDKINIISSQAVLELSYLAWTHSQCCPRHCRFNSLVKNGLFKTASDIDQPPFQFIHTMDLSVVDTMLTDSPELVVHRTEIWAVWRPQVGRKKVWRFLTQHFNCCGACPAGTKSLAYQTFCI